MSDKPIVTITAVTLRRWLFLGLPAIAFWSIGGMGALSLLGGLANGGVTPGGGSTSTSLGSMWAFIVLISVAGLLFGMGSLFRKIPKRVLALNLFFGFVSLFFSVLT